ncbi:ABC transporter ATP-binding protein [Anaeromyxobacter diazotrophicus]|uniref:ABC transporter ATP-binding protein n=1 Tax=Anaeromyxobacter diazotrophicus TaxID=2590199 RepID=A0A7I9VLU2_9BACT|nr:ABC transporter ATP-binding protein [Anaeromyxobacter diazotrophicus]GEJ57383.1 ABC transporter ATP-binding protein [Anaeromyxobacter diazotrophicus]
MIAIRDLHKSFGDHKVLDGITIDVERGTTFVVLGGSGSGKTVLMKHVIGLLKPDSGTVLVDGIEIPKLEGRELTEARRMFGMVFQGAALFDSMTVYDNVAFPLHERQRGIKPSELRERVIEKLKVVDLDEDVLTKFPAELSGGMRKRVALARAVVHEPKVVLYDEPTTGLDPITTAYVDDMILSAKQRLGVTSMVISHDIASAFKVADRMAVLYDGHLAAQGTPEEVRRSDHPYVQHYLSMWFEKQ